MTSHGGFRRLHAMGGILGVLGPPEVGEFRNYGFICFRHVLNFFTAVLVLIIMTILFT